MASSDIQLTEKNVHLVIRAVEKYMEAVSRTQNMWEARYNEVRGSAFQLLYLCRNQCINKTLNSSAKPTVSNTQRRDTTSCQKDIRQQDDEMQKVFCDLQTNLWEYTTNADQMQEQLRHTACMQWKLIRRLQTLDTQITQTISNMTNNPDIKDKSVPSQTSGADLENSEQTLDEILEQFNNCEGFKLLNRFMMYKHEREKGILNDLSNCSSTFNSNTSCIDKHHEIIVSGSCEEDI